MTNCCFLKRGKLFVLWILFTLGSWLGLLKFNILLLNILLVLFGIVPNSRFTGLNDISQSHEDLFKLRGRPQIDWKIIIITRKCLMYSKCEISKKNITTLLLTPSVDCYAKQWYFFSSFSKIQLQMVKQD